MRNVIKNILNEEVEYILPAIEDLEENPVNVKLATTSTFLTFNSEQNKIDISPKSPVSNLGIFVVKVVLSDYRLSKEY